MYEQLPLDPKISNALSAEQLRLQAVKVLGGKCVKCGIDDERVLHIDHINGSGNRERIAFNATYKIYRKVIAVGGKGYQLLCVNHNWLKRCEMKEYGSARKAG